MSRAPASAADRATRRAERAPAWALVAAGAGASAAAAGLLALAVVELGAFDVAASRPHWPIVYWATKTTMDRAVHWQARSVPAPPPFTQSEVAAGFRLYEANCVACHGAPGVAQGPPAKGMMPPPPYLIDSARERSPRELYWIVRHGITMTAMPAWDRTLTPGQTWQVVAFLERLHGLDYPTYRRMRDAQGAAAPAQGR